MAREGRGRSARNDAADGVSEVLRGELEQVRIVSSDFTIAKLKLRDGSVVTALGTFLGAREGDRVELVGAWTHHPKWGAQFKVRELRTTLPVDVSGAVAWIVSRIPGFGPARAEQAVRRFGADAGDAASGEGGIWHVLATDPQRLCEVAGITPALAERAGETYRQHAAARAQEVELRGWGLTDGQVARVIEVWGDKSVETLRADPYLLTEHVKYFGFARADEVARRMGLAASSPSRIRAGVMHVLFERAQKGDVFVPYGGLVRMAVELLDVAEGNAAPLVSRELRALEQSRRVVAQSGRVYLTHLHAAEVAVARRALALLATRGHPAANDSTEREVQGAA